MDEGSLQGHCPWEAQPWESADQRQTEGRWQVAPAEGSRHLERREAAARVPRSGVGFEPLGDPGPQCRQTPTDTNVRAHPAFSSSVHVHPSRRAHPALDRV